ncbi:hypothetical protein GCM10028800_01660 [Nesterenkonia populi]
MFAEKGNTPKGIWPERSTFHWIICRRGRSPICPIGTPHSSATAKGAIEELWPPMHALRKMGFPNLTNLAGGGERRARFPTAWGCSTRRIEGRGEHAMPVVHATHSATLT